MKYASHIPPTGLRGVRKKLCIICGKSFYIRFAKLGSRRNYINFRPKHCNTCSKICAKLYNRRIMHNNIAMRFKEK